jgi:hypothetical protein
MPRDEFHFRLILILLQVFVKFVLGGLSLITGVVTGAVLGQLTNIPIWGPLPFLILTMMSRRPYSSLFMLGVLMALLGGVIH